MMTNSRRWMLGAGWLFLALSFTGCGGEEPTYEVPNASSSLYSCGNFGGTTDSPALLKVANGTSCIPTDNSPVVLLEMYDANGIAGTCSGTVIAPKKVLTAAHCLTDLTSIMVRYADSQAKFQRVAAVGWAYHPQYSGKDSLKISLRSFIYDVGVVTLNSEIPVPKMPILISVSPVSGTNVSVYGFGMTNTGGPLEVLRFGTMTITDVTNEVIVVTYPGGTGSPFATGCPGDSGGPVIRAQGNLRGVVAVTSAGPVPCGTSGESSYTKLYNESIWTFLKTNAPDASFI